MPLCVYLVFSQIPFQSNSARLRRAGAHQSYWFCATSLHIAWALERPPSTSSDPSVHPRLRSTTRVIPELELFLSLICHKIVFVLGPTSGRCHNATYYRQLRHWADDATNKPQSRYFLLRTAATMFNPTNAQTLDEPSRGLAQ
jgi:hypothetical protein